MCYKVYPLLRWLQSKWEGLCDDPSYAPVKHALEAGLKNMKKWYKKTDETSIYFISHGKYVISQLLSLLTNTYRPVLDPRYKLSYLNAAGGPEWVAKGMATMRKIVD